MSVHVVGVVAGYDGIVWVGLAGLLDVVVVGNYMAPLRLIVFEACQLSFGAFASGFA